MLADREISVQVRRQKRKRSLMQQLEKALSHRLTSVAKRATLANSLLGKIRQANKNVIRVTFRD